MGPALLDLDGDGDLDIAGVIPTGTQILFFEQTAPRVFVVSPASLPTLSSPVRDLQAVDLDGDGRRDLVVTTTDLTWFRNVGSNALAPMGSLAASIGPETPRIRFGDLDSDGDLDVLYPNPGVTGLLTLENLGAGQFAAPGPVVLGLGQGLRDLAASDVSGDGIPDLTFINGTFSQRSLRIALGRPGGFAYSQPTVLRAQTYSGLDVADVDLDGDLDLVTTDEFFHSVDLWNGDRFTEIGDSECGPGVPNSTGLRGLLQVFGSDLVTNNQVVARASRLPVGSFGYLLVSQTADVTPGAGGSLGILCLGGEIGRYVGPGQVGQAGPAGQINVPVDLSAIPQPTGFVTGLAGQTWRFQTWHRDSLGGQPVSNFTQAVAVTLH